MSDIGISEIRSGLECFAHWLERYGETSFDHQSYFAGDFGRRAKALYYRKPLLGTLAVAPMIFSEAFVPSARRLFWQKQRFPIADAHYAMGYMFLHQALGQEQYYRRAVHFLEVLKQSRAPGYQHHGWGYPFHWVTRRGTIAADTPFITTLPYVYEAFRQVFEVDGNLQWRAILRSIAEHAMQDYRDIQTSPEASTCTYHPGPDESQGVINASAYRAFLLTRAAFDFSEERYLTVARRNLSFVLESQNENGSWFYSMDGQRDFVDHFHTCFVLKALAKIEQLTHDVPCRKAIDRGVAYYVRHLADDKGLPVPFSKPPRLTVYRRELYDYAECINLGVLLHGRSAELNRILSNTVQDVLKRWQKRDGSFRARELLIGWDNVPMHRWAQSQVFRSLSFLLSGAPSNSQAAVASGSLQTSQV